MHLQVNALVEHPLAQITLEGLFHFLSVNGSHVSGVVGNVLIAETTKCQQMSFLVARQMFLLQIALWTLIAFEWTRIIFRWFGCRFSS